MKIKSLFSGLFILMIFLWAGIAQAAPEENTHDYAILIKNGRMLDSSLNPSFRADVAVKDGRIVKVARSIPGKALTIIKANEKYTGKLPGRVLKIKK